MTHAIRRVLTTLAAAAASSLTAATCVWAHQLVVAQPGSADLDVGTQSRGTLVLATLTTPGDHVTLRATPPTASRIELFVPARQPEQQHARLRVTTRTGLHRDVAARTDATARVDEALGMRFDQLVTPVACAAHTACSIRVDHAASGATRIALRIAPVSEPFTTDESRRMPRTTLRAQAWYEPGGTVRGSASDARAARERASVGSFVALGCAAIALVTAAWWLMRGRRRARVRGMERATDVGTPRARR